MEDWIENVKIEMREEKKTKSNDIISNVPHKGQIIYYDDKNMMCYTVNVYDCIYDFSSQYIKSLVQYEIDFELGSKVKLDPTMMKRIAKYNVEKDIEILQKKKQKLEESIKRLEKDKEKQIKRLESVEDFILEFFDTEYNSVDDFIESKNNNY